MARSLAPKPRTSNAAGEKPPTTTPPDAPDSSSPTPRARLSRRELTIVGALHPFLALVTLGATRFFKVGNTSLVFATASAVACLALAWPYHRENPAVAPRSLKFQAGGLLAGLCLIEGVVIQTVWAPMIWPVAVIAVSMAGSALFPFLVYNSVYKHMRASA